MIFFRQSRWISTFLVAVIAVTWIAATNHCALAALEGIRQPSHSCCREGGEGHRQPPGTMTMQCCDTFRLTVPAPVVVPAASMLELPSISREILVPRAVVRNPESVEFHAHGPPRALGFAETVLNRSLLSHAPPVFGA